MSISMGFIADKYNFPGDKAGLLLVLMDY